MCTHEWSFTVCITTWSLDMIRYNCCKGLFLKKMFRGLFFWTLKSFTDFNGTGSQGTHDQRPGQIAFH